jgi:tetratricopeptide (TPR) repeat protein
MLCQEAVSLWQRFLLTSVGSDLIVNAHFALGLLKAQKGQLPDALAEYKLVANRFSQTSFAPYALLHSSRLKVMLRDYTGAREDLKQLTELYPDSEFSDQACLYLADATMKAGLFDEWVRLFCKAYNLGFSAQSKIASALGAGRCFYEQKDYAAAAEWLSRFISLAKDVASADFNLACFLLGKTYLALGKPERASDALEYALAGRLPRQEYIEAVSALVDARTQQGHFIEALEALERAQPWQFSQKESVEMSLLKTKVLRSMGLSDKAILVLADRAEYLLDTQLKAKVLYELAKCHIAEQDLELAHRRLTEVLVLIEPGPNALEVGCELAEVCLRLGQNSQVVSICSQLLDFTAENAETAEEKSKLQISASSAHSAVKAAQARIRQRAMNILATAQLRQKNYEGAVLALLGQPGARDPAAPSGNGSRRSQRQGVIDDGR